VSGGLPPAIWWRQRGSQAAGGVAGGERPAPATAEAAPGPGGTASPRWSTPSALAASASAFLNRRCRNWRAARAAAPELATITGMPKKPVTSTDELIRMLMQVEAAAAGILEQQMLHRLRQQTYVGGKRVDIQKLPRPPNSAATTVHRVKASLCGAKPPVWRRLEIPSAMTLQIFDGGGYRLFWRPSVDLSQMLPAEA
jgi:hypothetical protein